MKTDIETLALNGSGLAKDLGYLEEPELTGCKAPLEFCQAFLDLLMTLSRGDSEAFRLRVNCAGNIGDLITWAETTAQALSNV